LFKKYHPRINLTSDNTFVNLLNTIKPFSGHDNCGPWGLNNKIRKNISCVATLRNLYFKILSMRCIKFAQKTQEAKISAFKLIKGRFRRDPNFVSYWQRNGSWQTEKNLSLVSCFLVIKRENLQQCFFIFLVTKPKLHSYSICGK
jgi:hypothetical protein